MAALNRPTNATYEVHEDVTVDTQDNEDHSFCGIMFPIKCKDLLPVDHLVVKSVSVRGHLGSLTVWISNVEGRHLQDENRRRSCRNSSSSSVLRRNNYEDQATTLRSNNSNNYEYRVPLHPSSWTKLYDNTHKPCSRGHYTELVFDKPVRLNPGEMRAMYIHSTLSGDQAIVYDNSYYGSSERRYDDDKLSILTGRAHVSTTCFGQDPIWGWGNAWRDRREFVGRLAYGAVYKLWNPEVSSKFGGCFQDGARSLLLCQRRWGSPISAFPDEVVYYILNMCPWDWFDDSTKTMKGRRKHEMEVKKKKLLLVKEQEQRDQAQAQTIAATSAAAFPVKEEGDDAKPSASVNNATCVQCSVMKDDDDEDAKPTANDAACVRSSRIRERSSEAAGVLHVAQDGSKTTGLEDSDEDDDEVVGDDEEAHSDSDDNIASSDGSSEDDDHYHNANRRHFSFHHPDSDSDEDNNSEQADSRSPRTHWLRRQIARVHVLRALASMEDPNISLPH
eukprot:CAMPEP_0168220172 /NCGR_PEP_ID=MMETSP0140_2-20121125/9057_1 /TAXON_ID=44445 /ORGANISM="Pseudo-nitzschia australis, Strain 10249 10 AB" /LENGTH=502 /DNA_ID=CAMNT_0008148813 /DNA_START=127 /DNA_END=1635 /DNA_ORIENTATION=-